MDDYTVLIRPIITERASKEADFDKFTFAVAVKADKNLIKKVIEKKFNVKVLDVATRIMKGGTTRIGPKRVEVKKPFWKKATVKLQKGQKIVYTEVEEKVQTKEKPKKEKSK